MGGGRGVGVGATRTAGRLDRPWLSCGWRDDGRRGSPAYNTHCLDTKGSAAVLVAAAAAARPQEAQARARAASADPSQQALSPGGRKAR